MDKFIDRFRKLCSTTWKTVVHSKRKFLPFLLAALLIEFALFTVAMTFDSAMENQRRTVEDTYRYHAAVTGIDASAYNLITKEYVSEVGTYGVYDAVNVLQKPSSQGNIAYIRLTLHADTYDPVKRMAIDQSPEGLLREFVDRYTNYYPILDAYGVSVVTSPLYTLDADLAGMKTARNLAVLVIALLSAVTMVALYRNRTDSEKFLYGIYATFGANTKRLRLSAFCELFLCTLLVLLPAYYLSSVACAVLFGTSVSLPFRFHFFKISLIGVVLLLMAVIALVSIYLPMKIISHTEPMKLIVAEDNSNLVSHPRSGAGRGKLRFPFGYAALSMLRFRRHHILLAVTSGFFSVIFVAGLYLTGVYRQNLLYVNADVPEFHVTFSYENEDGTPVSVVSQDTVRDFLLAVNPKLSPKEYAFASPLEIPLPKGVASVHRTYSSAQGAPLGIVLSVPRSNVIGGDLLFRDDGTACTSDLRLLCAVDEDLPALIEETYQMQEGGNGALVADTDGETRYIMIGKTQHNGNAFSFEIGDKIRLSRPAVDEEGNLIPLSEEDTEEIPYYYSGNELLEQQLQKYTFETREYTVSAVMEDYPSAVGGIPVVLPMEDYEWLTGDTAAAAALDVRLSEGISLSEYETLRIRMETIDSADGNLHIECENRYARTYVETETPFASAISTAVSVTLILIPVLWFFTEIQFFRRRENEFYILQSISAPLSTVRTIYLQSALIMLPIGALSAALSYGILRLIHWLMSFFLPMYFGITGTTVAAFSVTSFELILCFTVTLLSSVLSAYLPYLGYRRRFLHEQQQENLYQE